MVVPVEVGLRRQYGQFMHKRRLIILHKMAVIQLHQSVVNFYLDQRENKIVFLCRLLTVLILFTHQTEHPSEDDVNGGLYAVMRNELRNAVEEIKMELEQVSNFSVM